MGFSTAVEDVEHFPSSSVAAAVAAAVVVVVVAATAAACAELDNGVPRHPGTARTVSRDMRRHPTPRAGSQRRVRHEYLSKVLVPRPIHPTQRETLRWRLGG